MQSRWVLVALGVRLTGKPKISTVVFAAVLKEEIEQLRDRDARHTYRITHLVRNLEEEEKANARLKYQVCKRASFSFSPPLGLSRYSLSLSRYSLVFSRHFLSPSLFNVPLCLSALLCLSRYSLLFSRLSLSPPRSPPLFLSRSFINLTCLPLPSLRTSLRHLLQVKHLVRNMEALEEAAADPNVHWVPPRKPGAASV